MHLPRAIPLATLALSLGWSGVTLAQAPAPADGAAATPGRLEQRIQRIHIEDAGSRIDELRVGGETQSITVAPKGGLPAYEVIPDSANRSLANGRQGPAANSGGTRVWKVMGF